MTQTAPTRPNYYLARLLAELSRMGGEHDAALAIGLLVAGRTGWLDQWADYPENDLNLNLGHGIIMQLLLRALAYVGNFTHIDLLAFSAALYAALEATEGVGLAMRRRWAEYLTVIQPGSSSLRALRSDQAPDPVQGRCAALKPGCGGVPGLPQASLHWRLTPPGSARHTGIPRDAPHNVGALPASSAHRQSTS